MYLLLHHCLLSNTWQKIEVLESRLLSNPLHNSPRLPDLYSQYANKIAIGEKIKNIKKEIASALSVIQLDELKSRKRVLRRLGFIDDADVVQLKARVACEISTGDELVLSELLFNRFFNELTPEQCAACLSCFIFEEKTQEVSPLKEELAKPYREIQQQARVIAKISQESKLTVNEEEYLKSFKFELMEVVFAWSKGATFAQIWYVGSMMLERIVTNMCSKMTDVYEGSLIRLFRRLEELLRQIAQAAKVMGSEELEQKFTAALELVRRDLVAAQSLYL
jgi:ATP-dependent RNA helicase DOB1